MVAVMLGGSRVSFYDLLMIVILILIIILKTEDNERDDHVPPGSVVVQAEWPEGPVDIDLWVRAPGDVAVGYSNKGGQYFNLLRDDLGLDATRLNYEVSYTRGQPDGEYVVNVHFFNTRQDIGPVPVHVEILMRLGRKYTTIFKRDVILEFQGQEITVQRFTIRDGAIVAQSTIPTPLRARF